MLNLFGGPSIKLEDINENTDLSQYSDKTIRRLAKRKQRAGQKAQAEAQKAQAKAQNIAYIKGEAKKPAETKPTQTKQKMTNQQMATGAVQVAANAAASAAGGASSKETALNTAGDLAILGLTAVNPVVGAVAAGLKGIVMARAAKKKAKKAAERQKEAARKRRNHQTLSQANLNQMNILSNLGANLSRTLAGGKK